jgi:hypothetical protein
LVLHPVFKLPQNEADLWASDYTSGERLLEYQFNSDEEDGEDEWMTIHSVGLLE